MEKDRTFLSLQTHHFASPKLYLFLSSHLSRVTVNIYLLLSLCLVMSIFSHPLVYRRLKYYLSFSIFFSILRDRPLVSFSIPHLSPHSVNFNLSKSLSIYFYHEMKSMQFQKVLCPFYIGEDYYFIDHKISSPL